MACDATPPGIASAGRVLGPFSTPIPVRAAGSSQGGYGAIEDEGYGAREYCCNDPDKPDWHGLLRGEQPLSEECTYAAPVGGRASDSDRGPRRLCAPSAGTACATDTPHPSVRSASVGCTRSARTVGTMQASRHTPNMKTAYGRKLRYIPHWIGPDSIDASAHSST